MVEQQGLDRIVDALALLASAASRARALFVGQGPLRATIAALAPRRGRRRALRRMGRIAGGPGRRSTARAASSCAPRRARAARASRSKPWPAARRGQHAGRRDGETARGRRNGTLCGFDVESLAARSSACWRRRGARAMGELGRRAVQRFETPHDDPRYAEGLQAIVAARGRRVKLLFLTQVLDRNDAVLGFVPRWIEALARALRARARRRARGRRHERLAGERRLARDRRSGTIRRWLRYRACCAKRCG
jgi:hypothetical protein